MPRFYPWSERWLAPGLRQRATNGPSFWARLRESVQQDEALLSAFDGLSKLDKANLLLSADPSVRILSKKVGPKGEEATF